MITIDNVLISRYLLLRDNTTIYSRVIIKISDIKKIESDGNTEVYSIRTNTDDVYTLRHNQASGKMLVDIGRTNLLTIENATNDFISILQQGDTILYNLATDPYDLQVAFAKVVKYQAKYRRFLVEIFGERHNLTTLLKKYDGDSKIVAIKTYDFYNYKIEKLKEATK